MPFYPPTTSYTDHELKRIVDAATRKAFEQAAEYAHFWWDVLPARDRCTLPALKDLKVGIRALAEAEEQADG